MATPFLVSAFCIMFIKLYIKKIIYQYLQKKNLYILFLNFQSCENSAIFWKPGRLEDTELKINDNIVTIIHKLEFKHSEIWFLKFSMDAAQKVLLSLIIITNNNNNLLLVSYAEMGALTIDPESPVSKRMMLSGE